MPTVLRRVGRLSHDRLLLGRAATIARGYTPEQLTSVRQLYDAATSRIALADESTDAWYAPAAVTLHRKVVGLLASALLVSKKLSPPGPALDVADALAKIEELVLARELPPLPRRYAKAKTLLETPDHLLFADEDAVEKSRGRAAVEALVQWLRRQVEPRSMRQIWVARVMRVALAIAAIGLLVRFAVPVAVQLVVHQKAK